MNEERETLHVAIALVMRQGEVLVGRRASGVHLAGLWEFPGGKREEGEDIRECLERELAEEVGIALAEAAPLSPPILHRYDEKDVVLFPFLCRPEDDREERGIRDGWRWVAPSDLVSLEFPPANGPLLRFLARG